MSAGRGIGAVPVGGGAVPGAAEAVEGVGGGAEADIGEAAPVGAVVDGFAAGEGEVGDFVVDIAGGGEGLAEQRVLPGRRGVGRLAVAAGADQAVERAVRIDGQLVGGNVLGTERDGLPQGLRPNCIGELREAENQVEADVVEAGFAQRGKGAAGARGIMPPVHPPQDSVVPGLHPHADAVDAQRPQAAGVPDAPGHDVIGVNFHREFFENRFLRFARNDREGFARNDRRIISSAGGSNGIDDGCELVEGEEGGGAAAEVEGVDGGGAGGGDFGAAGGGLSADAAEKVLHLRRLRPGTDPGMEAAVGAKASAERNVQINHRAGP